MERLVCQNPLGQLVELPGDSHYHENRPHLGYPVSHLPKYKYMIWLFGLLFWKEYVLHLILLKHLHPPLEVGEENADPYPPENNLQY